VGLTAALGSLVIAPAVIGIARVEPYPTLYFGAASGGLARVSREHLFEVGGWCEGIEAATRWIDRNAEPGESIIFTTECHKSRPRFRDDLDEVMRPGRADWAVMTSFVFELETPPHGCRAAHDVIVDGVPLARAYDCRTGAGRSLPRPESAAAIEAGAAPGSRAGGP
jgi:hypothetical protein